MKTRNILLGLFLVLMGTLCGAQTIGQPVTTATLTNGNMNVTVTKAGGLTVTVGATPLMNGNWLMSDGRPYADPSLINSNEQAVTWPLANGGMLYSVTPTVAVATFNYDGAVLSTQFKVINGTDLDMVVNVENTGKKHITNVAFNGLTLTVPANNWGNMGQYGPAYFQSQGGMGIAHPSTFNTTTGYFLINSGAGTGIGLNILDPQRRSLFCTTSGQGASQNLLYADEVNLDPGDSKTAHLVFRFMQTGATSRTLIDPYVQNHIANTGPIRFVPDCRPIVEIGGFHGTPSVPWIDSPADVAYILSQLAPVGAIIDSTPPTMVDDSVATVVGTWLPSTYTPGYTGVGYITDGNTGKGTKSVTYTPNLTGTYQVTMNIIGGSNRATNVPVDVYSSGGTKTTVTVNEQPSSKLLLGTFVLDASSKVVIRTDNTNNYVIADSISFSKPPTRPSLVSSLIVWGIGGNDVRGAMYRPDADVWPDVVKANVPAFVAGANKIGVKVGMQMRPSALALRLYMNPKADGSDVDTIVSSGKEQIPDTTRRLGTVINQGICDFYFDVTGGGFSDVYMLGQFRSSIGNLSQFWCEHATDMILRDSGVWTYMTGTPGNFQIQSTQLGTLATYQIIQPDMVITARLDVADADLPAALDFCGTHKIIPMLPLYKAQGNVAYLAAWNAKYLDPNTNKFK